MNTGDMNFVAVAGFGDTTRYWADRLACYGTVTCVEWPGVWDKRDIAKPLSYVVDAVARVARGSVLVGHSAGCRAILSAASQEVPVGIVLLAPALGPLSFLGEEALATWRRQGYRTTSRPGPDGGVRELRVPVSYADDLGGWEMPGVPSCPVLVLLMSDDQVQNEVSRTLLVGSSVKISTICGPHRWWEQSDVCAQVDADILSWLKTFAV